MLLTIDIGNSNIVFGIYQDNKMLESFRLEAGSRRTEDEFAALIISCLSNFGLDYKRITGVIVSSNGLASINPMFENLALKYFKTKAIFVGANLKSGVAIKIEQPKTLAPDILVGIVGAMQKYGGDCLVVDLGTATTMTILTAENDYIGGVIMPGIKTGATALSRNTAGLPYIELEAPDHVICKETVSAMQSGLIYGYAAQIDGMIIRIEKEFSKPLKVILTGGLAHVISNVITREIIMDENLILDGLNYLYQKNKETI